MARRTDEPSHRARREYVVLSRTQFSGAAAAGRVPTDCYAPLLIVGGTLETFMRGDEGGGSCCRRHREPPSVEAHFDGFGTRQRTVQVRVRASHPCGIREASVTIYAAVRVGEPGPVRTVLPEGEPLSGPVVKQWACGSRPRRAVSEVFTVPGEDLWRQRFHLFVSATDCCGRTVSLYLGSRAIF